ncbi:GTPase HflX [Fusobacterium sp. MFO224]|uniref:GTPase HflX n=1 Tax=Fusobacterium sp. MFO224 TaxID=3378070 RepID=UPI0038541D92
MIKGNTIGIKSHILKELDELLKEKIEKTFFIKKELIFKISEISSKINKEISITIDRNGKIIDINIGDSSSASIPNISFKERKLSGHRIVHTHPNGNPKLSKVDISALIELKLDSMIAVGIDKNGAITGINFAFCKIKDDNISHEEFSAKNIEVVEDFNYLAKVQEIEKELKNKTNTEDETEYAILVGRESKDSLLELKELGKACDIETVDIMLQKGNNIDKKFYIGKGKVAELYKLKQIRSANLIIFDEELSGIQIRNLEENLNCKVIDRTFLILEIFARRAKSKEAKIQIKLAKLKYESARLIGLGTSLSRIGGGIGNRGLGETKLELDRRNIKDKISSLKKELTKIKNIRTIQRERRETSGIGKISLVGYTNVGKSTLRNLIVQEYCDENTAKTENVLAKNMLFATLDTTIRVIKLNSNREVAFIDTVGFIRKLPHDLIEAFKSTLEEVIYSDVLIHVVDVSSKNLYQEIDVVENVLKELNSNNKPTILALNKTDLITKDELEKIKENLKKYYIIEISAKNNTNIDILLDAANNLLPNESKKVEYLIPYTDTSISAYLHSNANVLEEEFLADGIKIKALVDEKTFNKCKKFIILS